MNIELRVRRHRLAQALAVVLTAAFVGSCSVVEPIQPGSVAAPIQPGSAQGPLRPGLVPQRARQRLPGYLRPGALDITRILPPAPVKGGPRYRADRRIFRETRALRGSARWAMAITDANLRPAQLLRHFACSMDAEVTPDQVPHLLHIMRRASRDAGHAIATAKHHFRRLRPFWIDEGPTCRPRTLVGATFDYPSGHATMGWMWAMILAQTEPDRATPILERGRSIGESRVVCGVHNASAIWAGRMTATAVMTLVMATPAYQRDLAAARGELAALRRSVPRPNPEQCAVESKLVAEGYRLPGASAHTPTAPP